jgi:hypothetical protein
MSGNSHRPAASPDISARHALISWFLDDAAKFHVFDPGYRGGYRGAGFAPVGLLDAD